MIPPLHLHAETQGTEENISVAYGSVPRCGEIPRGRAPATENTADLVRDSSHGTFYTSLSVVPEHLLFSSPVLSPGSSQMKRCERCSCHGRLFLKRLLKGGGTRVMRGPVRGMCGRGSLILLITTLLHFWNSPQPYPLSTCRMITKPSLHLHLKRLFYSQEFCVHFFQPGILRKQGFYDHIVCHVLTVCAFLLTSESHRTRDRGLQETFPHREIEFL